MYKPNSIYAELALMTIERFLNKQSLDTIEKYKSMDEMKKSSACFVSIYSNGYLRGCIGTIFPFRDTLYDEIVGNAIAASTEDPRFIPMTAEELEEIEVSVDVLSEPEKVTSVEELNPEKYGIIVSDGVEGTMQLTIPTGDSAATSNLSGISDFGIDGFTIIPGPSNING